MGFHFRLKPESPPRAQPQRQTPRLDLGGPPLADSAEQGNNLDAALLVSQNISLQDLVLGPYREVSRTPASGASAMELVCTRVEQGRAASRVPRPEASSKPL